MRTFQAAVMLGFALCAGCKCGNKTPADAGTPVAVADSGPPVAVEAPVSEPIKLLREADAAFQAGNQDEAVAKAKQVTEAQPRNPVAANTMGRAYAAKFEQSKDPKDAEAARAAFEKALAIDPRFFPAMLNLGALEEKLGNTQAAAAQYQKVLEIDPAHPDKERFQKLIDEAAPKPKAPKKK